MLLPWEGIYKICIKKGLEREKICKSGEGKEQKIMNLFAAAAAAKSLQSCPTLCDPRDSSPPGSPVPGILQARTLEWVAISFSSAWKWKVKVKSLSRVRLRNPMDCSPPGSSVHGIFQARVLEWGATAFSGGPVLLLCNSPNSALLQVRE